MNQEERYRNAVDDTYEEDNRAARCVVSLILAALAALALLVLLAQTVKAEDEFAVYEKRAFSFITKHSPYDATGIPSPTYKFITTEEMNRMFYGERYTNQNDVEAVYNTGVVFFQDNFRLPDHGHILVHELVHHVIFHLGIEFRCKAAEEEVAYNIQHKWVDETGYGDKADPMWMMFLKCREWH